MFGRLSAAFVYAPLALAVLAAAKPWGTPPPPPVSQCNTGPIQCCNSVQSAGSADVVKELGILGVVVQDVNVLVGLKCTPILASSNSCTSEPVCCTGNNFNGLVVIGCSPININA